MGELDAAFGRSRFSFLSGALNTVCWLSFARLSKSCPFLSIFARCSTSISVLPSVHIAH